MDGGANLAMCGRAATLPEPRAKSRNLERKSDFAAMPCSLNLTHSRRHGRACHRKSGLSYCVTIFSAASDLRVEPSNMDIVGDIGQAQQSGDDAWSRLSLECVAQAATADP